MSWKSDLKIEHLPDNSDHQPHDDLWARIKMYLLLGFTKEEVITRALNREKIKQKDIAKVLNASIRTVSRRSCSAEKKMKAPKRDVPWRNPSSETISELEDIILKAIQFAPIAIEGRPRCPECGDPRPYPNRLSWLCRACGKTWAIDKNGEPEKFKDRPECPNCEARHAWSKGDRWQCGQCGKRWFKKADRRAYGREDSYYRRKKTISYS
jgi:uncharacterized Zn ribbon protein